MAKFLWISVLFELRYDIIGCHMAAYITLFFLAQTFQLKIAHFIFLGRMYVKIFKVAMLCYVIKKNKTDRRR